MKIRTGFVSNSSSSSFLVCDARRGFAENPDELKKETLIVNKDLGETEFGWGPDIISDIGSRIIFSYLQFLCCPQESWLKMLENVIKKSSSVKNIVWNITLDYNDKEKDWGYIDHQSSSIYGKNTEIFDNEEKLKDFIFGRDSKIVLDNDNH